MRILKKKIKTEFVSKKEFDEAMNNMTAILEGMKIATSQQAQMLASMANQLMQSQKKSQEVEKEAVQDVSIQ